jgi:phosphoribosyl 1,2-cyclic phosphate phosphodiesterase
MKLIILGSGGAITTPQPCCQCKLCKKARKLGEPFKRNNSSLFLEDVNTLIDCGEDIADSLNRRDIKKINNLFITHWHPDHTFGMRNVLEPNLDFMTEKPRRVTNVYIPNTVYETLKKRFPVVEYYFNVQKTGILHLTEDGDEIKLGDYIIKVVGFKGKESDTYGYLIQNKNKSVLYTPCDTIRFDNYKNFIKLDLLINECGVFSNFPTEISFDTLMRRIREIKPKKTILTHIEEIEVSKFGERYLDKMKKQYSDVNFDYAFDGMKIII